MTKNKSRYDDTEKCTVIHQQRVKKLTKQWVKQEETKIKQKQEIRVQIKKQKTNEDRKKKKQKGLVKTRRKKCKKWQNRD